MGQPELRRTEPFKGALSPGYQILSQYKNRVTLKSGSPHLPPVENMV